MLLLYRHLQCPHPARVTDPFMYPPTPLPLLRTRHTIPPCAYPSIHLSISLSAATSGYTHCSGFSVRSHGVGKGAAGNREEAVFMAQSTLTPEELDGILKVCDAIRTYSIPIYVSYMYHIHNQPTHKHARIRHAETIKQIVDARFCTHFWSNIFLYMLHSRVRNKWTEFFFSLLRKISDGTMV